MPSTTTSSYIEYFDDESTIPMVDQPITLHARWQEKSCKVQYYKGTADRVAFHLVRRLTPKNGGNWIGYEELGAGDGFNIYTQVENTWQKFALNDYRLVTKKNGGNWSDIFELTIGDEGKWYVGSTEITLENGDIAIIVDETDGKTDEDVYQYYPKGGGVWWQVWPQQMLTTRDGNTWKDLDTLKDGDNKKYYFYGFQKKKGLVGGEMATLDNAHTYLYSKTKNTWQDYTGEVDTEPLLRITKQDGSDWNSIDELNDPETKYYSNGQQISLSGFEFAVVKGKWYANGVETTPIQGDCAYVNSNDNSGTDVIQQWEYDHGSWRMIDQYEQPYNKGGISYDNNGSPIIIINPSYADSYIDVYEIENGGIITKSDKSLWKSIDELKSGDDGKWYKNGQVHTSLKDDDLAIVQSDGVQTFYIYKAHEWIEYKDEDVSGANQYTQTVVIGKKATLRSNKFVRKGYNFLGWCTEQTNDMPPFINTNLKEVQENDNTIYQQFVQRNHQMTAVPDAEREGYHFLGWFTPDGASFSKGFYVTEDMMVYPRWQKKDDEIPTPTPIPTPEPEDDGNPGSGSQDDTLDDKKYVRDPSVGTGIGLCGNILYMNFNSAQDIKGKALNNCRVYANGSTSSTSKTKCSHYKATCTTAVYTHPDAPGKKFLKVEVLPGKDLDTIKKKNGTEVNINEIPNFAAELNRYSWYPQMDKPPKKFRDTFTNWNDYKWKEFGQWGNSDAPLMQYPGHKFRGWYLGYDACTSKNTTLPIEGEGKYYRPDGISRQQFYICTDYLQKVSRTIGGKTTTYRGFIFYPKFD